MNKQVARRRLALLAVILMSGGNLIIPRLPLAMLVLLIAILSCGFPSGRINKRMALIYVWLALVMVFAFFRVHHVEVSANITRLINFAVAVAVVKIYWGQARHHFLSDIRAIMIPVAYLGIITVTMGLILPGLFALVQIGAQPMHTFGGLFNFMMPLIVGAGIPRPMGIFWEPGVFAAYLNVLLFVLFIQKDKLVALAVVFITILLTQSTTGIGVAVMQGSYFIITTMFGRRLKVREMLLLLVAALSAPVIIFIAIQNISEKLTGASVGSFSARSFDMLVALEVIEENPLVGIGFSQEAYIQYFGDSSLDTSSLSEINQIGRLNTNGVMIIFYSVGMPLGLVYFLGVFRQKIVPHRLMFGAVLIVSLASSPLSLTPFFLFLAFSGLVLRPRSTLPKGLLAMGNQLEGSEKKLDRPSVST